MTPYLSRVRLHLYSTYSTALQGRYVVQTLRKDTYIYDKFNLTCTAATYFLLRGLSPRANYTDRAAATGRRS